MRDPRLRTARVVTQISETCLMTLLMLPVVIATAAVRAPWALYQRVTGRRVRITCPGCPYCDTIVAVRLPKDLH